MQWVSSDVQHFVPKNPQPLHNDNLIVRYSNTSNPFTRNKPDEFFGGVYLDIARAVQKDDVNTIVSILQNNKWVDLNILGNSGMSLLAFAMANRNTKSMEVLLKFWADPNLRVFDTHEHLVAMAASSIVREGDRMFDLLLQYWWDPNADIWWTPALHQTVYARRYDRMKKLLQLGADIDSVDEKTNASLMQFCAVLNQFEAVLYLIEQGADFERRDSLGSAVEDEVQEARWILNPEAEYRRKQTEIALIERGVQFPLVPVWIRHTYQEGKILKPYYQLMIDDIIASSFAQEHWLHYYYRSLPFYIHETGGGDYLGYMFIPIQRKGNPKLPNNIVIARRNLQSQFLEFKIIDNQNIPLLTPEKVSNMLTSATKDFDEYTEELQVYFRDLRFTKESTDGVTMQYGWGSSLKPIVEKELLPLYTWYATKFFNYGLELREGGVSTDNQADAVGRDNVSPDLQLRKQTMALFSWIEDVILGTQISREFWLDRDNVYRSEPIIAVGGATGSYSIIYFHVRSYRKDDGLYFSTDNGVLISKISRPETHKIEQDVVDLKRFYDTPEVRLNMKRTIISPKESINAKENHKVWLLTILALWYGSHWNLDEDLRRYIRSSFTADRSMIRDEALLPLYREYGPDFLEIIEE